MILGLRHRKRHLDVNGGGGSGDGESRMLASWPRHVVVQGLAGSGVGDRVRGEVRDVRLEMIHEARVLLGGVHGARDGCFASTGEADAGRCGEEGVGRRGGRPGVRRMEAEERPAFEREEVVESAAALTTHSRSLAQS